MKSRILLPGLAIAVALSVHPAPAADKAADAARGTKAGQQAKPADAPRRALKLVEINTAGKAELKKLPGIGEAEAEKIVAGRPYGSKSHLVTRGIIPRAVYEGLKSRIMVRPANT